MPLTLSSKDKNNISMGARYGAQEVDLLEALVLMYL